MKYVKIEKATKNAITYYTHSGRIIDPWYKAEYLLIPHKGYIKQFSDLETLTKWIIEHEKELL